MGFLDKAKVHLPKGFGDETVRVVNYGKDSPEEAPKPKTAPKEKPAKPPREPKPPRVKQPKAARPKKEDFVAPKEEVEETPEEVEVPEVEDSAFDIDPAQQDFFADQQKKYDEAMSERLQSPHELQVSADKIADVLEVLQIPATFAIESDVFLPEDLEDIVFDLQAPYGFEQGQVTTFLERTRVTVARYVALLRLRNEHVAKLASVIDRLQVDANNLRFQNEISSGINVMPTTDSEDLENQLLEAKLKIKRLEDQVRTFEHGDALTSNERATFEGLQDTLSIVQRENEDLKEEVYGLKNQLAYLEEESDEEPAVPSGTFEEEEEYQSFPSVEELDLPSVDEPMDPGTPSVKPAEGSAFYVDEEDDAAFASTIELIGDDYTTSTASNMLTDEEEDDELDAMMRDWNKQ